VRVALSFQTALSAHTIEGMLDTECLRKYVVRYTLGAEDIQRKTIVIEFDDPRDRDRFSAAYKRLSVNKRGHSTSPAAAVAKKSFFSRMGF
jgi:hypothetical protein